MLRRLNLSMLAPVCAVLLACGGDDAKTTAPIGPAGEVQLFVTGFLNDRGESYTENDAIRLSCDDSITVELGPREGASLQNWLLKPPGTCGSFVQCGYVMLTLEAENGDTRVVTGASTAIVLPAPPGLHRLRAELVNGEGEPFLWMERPVVHVLDALEFTPAADCVTPTSTSSGGVTGGANGGSSNTGGAGATGSASLGGAAGAGSGFGGAAGAAGDAGASAELD
jgi:hypothetical protein